MLPGTGFALDDTVSGGGGGQLGEALCESLLQGSWAA